MIRWRYKLDYNGDIELDNDGQPVKESNARLVKLMNGTYKLLVGDATFYTSIHKTEKRCKLRLYYMTIFSLSLSLCLCLSLSVSLSLSLFLSYSLSLILSPLFSLTFSISLSLSLSLSLCYSLSVTLSLSLCYSLPLSLPRPSGTHLFRQRVLLIP